jgi:hypothetical protein
MSALHSERIRAGHEQGNRFAVWLLLALAVALLVARHIAPLILVGRLDDQLLTAADVLAAMPVLLAAVVVLVVPGNRLMVAGGVALATAAVLLSTWHLVPLVGGGDLPLLLGLAAAPLLVAGPLLLGHGLGGVGSRLGVALVAGGLVVAVLAAAYAFTVTEPMVTAAPFGSALVVATVIQQCAYFGWAYLLAAAVERRAVFIAVGAGLWIAVNAAILLLVQFAGGLAPGFDLVGAGIVYFLLSLGAWVALIVGFLREVAAAPAEVPPPW